MPACIRAMTRHATVPEDAGGRIIQSRPLRPRGAVTVVCVFCLAFRPLRVERKINHAWVRTVG